MKTLPFSLQSTAERAISELQKRHVDAAEVIFGASHGFSVEARLGEVETLEHDSKKSFTVSVIHEQRSGSASSTDFSADAIVATVEKAISIASFATPDPFAGLASPGMLAFNYPDCDLYHPWDITPAEAIKCVIDCEKQALSIDKRIVNSEGASLSTHASQLLYANTLGFMGGYRYTDHVLHCSLLASNGDGMQRDDEYTVARNAKELWSIEVVAKAAALKTLKKLGARKIKTQNCSVMFEATVAKSLLGHFIAAISGSNLYRQTSFLLNQLNKPIFPAFMNIFQEPHLLSAMGSCPFDSEGVRTVNQHYVKAGELVSYALGSYSARKLKMQSTGNAGGVFNLSLTPHALNFEQLLKKMNRGLLVTELMGQGVSITTGDYSRGAAGFWVENGEIQYPVEEITIAGNLKNMFANLVACANDIDTRSGIRTGSILIDQMTVAGE